MFLLRMTCKAQKMEEAAHKRAEKWRNSPCYLFNEPEAPFTLHRYGAAQYSQHSGRNLTNLQRKQSFLAQALLQKSADRFVEKLTLLLHQQARRSVQPPPVHPSSAWNLSKPIKKAVILAQALLQNVQRYACRETHQCFLFPSQKLRSTSMCCF